MGPEFVGHLGVAAVAVGAAKAHSLFAVRVVLALVAIHTACTFGQNIVAQRCDQWRYSGLTGSVELCFTNRFIRNGDAPKWSLSLNFFKRNYRNKSNADED